MNDTLNLEKAAKSCCCGARTAVHPQPQNTAPFANFWRDKSAWKKAAQNTFNCLIGCSIGDFGAIIIIQTYFPATPMLLTMVLAMAAGLVTSILFESTLLRLREGFAWRVAFAMAFSMSFLSMLGMELAANLTDFVLTGGRVPVGHPFYWTALAISLAAGFVAPLPYNYYKFKKHGKACH
jgi:hypothetical protein